MDRFDLIGYLRTLATTNGWIFLSGESWMQNYEATQATIGDGQFILGADFKASPQYRNGLIESIKYTGGLIFGRKYELTTATESTLDETYIQKYDARLKELSTLLAGHISTIACANAMDVEGVTFAPELNKFDTNIDFMAASLTFVQ